MMTSTTPSSNMAHIGVGIDTARYGHRVTFLREDRQPAAAAITVTENQPGFRKLRRQLEQLHEKHPEARFHVHVDAAGQYATNLEQFLRGLELPITLSIGEPKRNKDYHKAFSPKKSTDDTESRAMARFGVVEQPQSTPEVPRAFRDLREIASRLQGQIKDTTRAANRLHNVLARVFPELATLVRDIKSAWVRKLLKRYPTAQRIAAARLSSIEKIPYIRAEKAKQVHAAAADSVGSFSGEVAEALVQECALQVGHCLESEKRLENLLAGAYRALPASGHIHVESIPGIGETAAAVLVAKMVSIDRFESAEHLVGYFGIFPEENTSGVDRKGKKVPPGTEHMSAKGNDLVRRYLWNAAGCAIQRDTAVAELYQRLRKRGKRGDVALGHCMRKLLHQVFGVWASNTPYDEAKAKSRHLPEAQAPATSKPADDSDAPSEKETAAGHKRDVLPERKVVTAATASVELPPASVNRSAEHAGPVDYAYLRDQITIERILSHLGYLDRLRGSGDERRGRCPLHDSNGSGKRDFSVNLGKNVFRCFHPQCNQQGNALDLWAAIRGLPLYEAALNLAATFNLQTQPEQRRGARTFKPENTPSTPKNRSVITPDAT